MHLSSSKVGFKDCGEESDASQSERKEVEAVPLEFIVGGDFNRMLSRPLADRSMPLYGREGVCCWVMCFCSSDMVYALLLVLFELGDVIESGMIVAFVRKLLGFRRSTRAKTEFTAPCSTKSLSRLDRRALFGGYSCRMPLRIAKLLCPAKFRIQGCNENDITDMS